MLRIVVMGPPALKPGRKNSQNVSTRDTEILSKLLVMDPRKDLRLSESYSHRNWLVKPWSKR